MQKIYVDEKRKRRDNRGQLPAWYIEDDHPAIVSRKLCEKCGWPLYRTRRVDGMIVFSCSGSLKQNVSFCSGIRVSEEVLDRLPQKDGYFILREEATDGEKHYSYTCNSEKPERRGAAGSEKDQGRSVLPRIDGQG